MKTNTIKFSGLFAGSPHQVFEIWMDSAKHAHLTGGEAKISRAVGGEFVTFDGWASGKNIALIKDRKIVQTWRGEDWPAGHDSTLTIKLVPTSNGTKLIFTQTGVPNGVAKDVAKGWKEYYWEPLHSALAREN